MADPLKSEEKTREQTPGMFSAVERLVGATAVLGAGLYVLVNGLYIEFYDDFGVRPEQVGFDRLAVLARSGWVALVAIAITGPIVIVLIRRSERKQRQQFYEQADAILGRDGTEDSDGSPADMLALERAHLTARQGWLRLRWIGMMTFAASILFLVAFAAFAYRIDVEADRVATGQSSNGIGWLVPLIDVRANRAEVTWVDPDKTAPPGLEKAPFLTFLGSGTGVTVLLACGETTYIVQSSAVVVALLDQGNPSDTDNDKTQRAAFKKACD